MSLSDKHLGVTTTWLAPRFIPHGCPPGRTRYFRETVEITEITEAEYDQERARRAEHDASQAAVATRIIDVLRRAYQLDTAAS